MVGILSRAPAVDEKVLCFFISPYSVAFGVIRDRPGIDPRCPVPWARLVFVPEM